jgi:ferredoxin-type protein NapG
MMERRHFLQQGLALGTGGLVISGSMLGLVRLLAPREVHASTQVIPLPGALADPAAFAAACIGCGLCGEVCPPRCIVFYRRDGAREVNTPYINPEDKSCILCGKCMAVCPTNALSITPREKIKMGFARIDRTACYPWVDRGVCGACVSVCPLGDKAIGFDFGNFYRPVVKDGCVGCGQCVEVCPEPSLPIRIAQPGQQVPRKEYKVHPL